MQTATHKTTTVVGLFNSPQEAESAIRDLQSAGIPRDDISPQLERIGAEVARLRGWKVPLHLSRDRV